MTLFPNTTTNPLKNMKTPALSPGYPVIFSRNQTAFLSGCKKSRVLLAACIAFLAFCLCAENGRAAIDTWSATASTGSWTTAGNWSDVANAHPASGDSLIFGASTTTALTDDLMTPATYTIGNITFNAGAPAYTITPNTGGSGFTLGGGGTIANNSSNTQTIGDNINLAGGATLNAASGALTLNGSFGGTIGASVNITPTNTITLGGNDTFTFNVDYTILNFNAGAGGTVITGTVNSIGSGGSNPRGYLNMAGNTTVTVAAGGSLSFNPSSNAGSIVGQNAAGTSTIVVNGGSFTLSGGQGIAFGNSNASAVGVLTVSSGTATINAGNSTNHDPDNMIAMGRDIAGASGIINLNGGVLATGRQFVRGGDSGNANVGSATFNFNGGTLRALASGTSGAGWFETATTGNYRNVTTNVLAGGATVDTNSFNANINTVLTHGGTGTDGGLTKVGAGTLTLGAANTFTGATTVSSGTLALGSGGSINSSSGITINGAGATFLQSASALVSPGVTLTQGALIVSGTINNTVSVASLAGNTVQNASSALTIGNLTFSGSGLLNINDPNSVNATTPGIVVSGILTTANTHAGEITVSATPGSGAWANGTYDLLAFNSITGASGDFVAGTIADLTTRQSAAVGLSGTYVTLTISGDSPKWTGLDSGNWVVGTTGPSHNWKLITLGTPTDYIQGDTVLFDDSATGSTTVNISAANVSPTLTTFNNSALNYTLTSGGGFGIASGGLTKSGTGTLTISNTNTFSGATTVNGGIINYQNATSFGGSSAITVNAGGTIQVQGGLAGGSSALTLAGSGAANATGALESVSGNNSYAGLVTLGGNTVITSDTGTGTLTLSNAGAITGSGYNLTLSGSGNGSIAGGIQTGAGGVTMNGSGTWALSGAGSYSGGTTINSGGTIAVGNNSALGTGTLTLNGGTLSDTSAGASIGNNVVIGSNGGSIVTGGADLSLTGTLSGAGNVNIPTTAAIKSLNWNFAANTMTSGTITVANGGGNTQVFRLNSPAATSAALDWVLGGASDRGNLMGAAGTYNFGSLAGSGLLWDNFLASNQAVIVSIGGDNNSANFTGQIRTQGATVSVIKIGTGTETLSGANNYNGGTTLTSGTLQLGNTSALGATTGALAVNGGTLDLHGFSPTVGVLSGSSGGRITTLTSGLVTLTSSSASSSAYAGGITDGSGQAALTVKGGTLNLSGSSNYTGATNVTGGTLIVSGSLSGATAVTVASGATMEVDGFVNNSGAAAINGTLLGTGSMGAFSSTGATIEPGLSTGSTTTGTLKANGNVSLDSASTLSIRVGVSLARSGSDNDVLASTGAVSLNGNLNLALGNAINNALQGTLYNIILAGSAPTGSFANVIPIAPGEGQLTTSGGYLFDVFYDTNGTAAANTGNDVTLELVSVPEPGTWAMMIGGMGMLVAAQRMRRRNT